MKSGQLSRRAFLEGGTLFLAGAAAGPVWRCLLDEKPLATIGIVTDIHHADKAPNGTRYYRQSLAKLDEALSALKARKVDRLVHMGDLVDSHPKKEDEEQAMRTVAERFRKTGLPYHFLLGNHCLEAVDKARYSELTHSKGGNEAFDVRGVRFVCLDACFRADGVPYANKNFVWNDCFVPESQIAWMEAQIKSAKGPCIVLTHQLLDGLKDVSVKNHEAVRKPIAASGKVTAVLQGHYHQNRLEVIDGVPYTVLRSIVDGPELANSGYSVLSVYKDGSAKLEGFREQESRDYVRRGSLV